MHRHTNRAALVGNRAGDSLANPPGGVSTELVAALVLKFLGCADEADVAFLNQIKEWHTPAHILFGYANNQAGVGSDQMLPGKLPILDEFSEFQSAFGAYITFGKFFPGAFAFFDALREGNFFLDVTKQGNPADFL